MALQVVTLRGWTGKLGGKGDTFNRGFSRQLLNYNKRKRGHFNYSWRQKKVLDDCCGCIPFIQNLNWFLTSSVCLRYQTTSQLGRQNIYQKYNNETLQTWMNLPQVQYCHQRLLKKEECIHSLSCIPDKAKGRFHKTLMEMQYPRLAHNSELLPLQAKNNIVGKSKQNECLISKNLNFTTIAIDYKMDGIRMDVRLFKKMPSKDTNKHYLDTCTLFNNEYFCGLCHPGFLYSHLQAHPHWESLIFESTQPLNCVDSTSKNEKNMDEQLAVMFDKLRIELPNYFLRSHDYSIYSQDVEFINGFLHMKTRGRVTYQVCLTLCRFLAWNYFADLHMEVLKLTQHQENWTIQARWRIRGLPFHVFLLRFYKKDKTELYRTYDAFSTFFLDSNGQICCHKLDKMMPVPPQSNKVKGMFASLLVLLGIQEHRPALNH
ncbi:uncharacterized protein C6orf136 homolog isoform X1 [Erpetoichthys calabaricus]|uniref:Uncharacterized protein n=1 Tax=Erpetoichthys calabaricus TaxID=27687 RepID=A0A8C4RPR8_ERPCA|nr:uncharacterized protein C6orf136 homolog isoform X1 [Erpetoichthys calabaricus]